MYLVLHTGTIIIPILLYHQQKKLKRLLLERKKFVWSLSQPTQSASASPATNNNNSSNQGTSRATVTDPNTNTTTVVPVSYTYERSSENSKEVTITITSIPDEYVPTSNTITVNIDEPTPIPGTPVIITIEEEDVPLAGAPKTGENNIPFMIFGSAFTMVVVAGITYFFSKKSEEE